MKINDPNLPLDEAIEYIRISPSNFLRFHNNIKNCTDNVMKLVKANPMILQYVITFFMKNVKSNIRVDELINLIETGVKANPSAFPTIDQRFITEKCCTSMVEVMKKEKRYVETWIVNIPVKNRDYKFMEEAVAANKNLLNNDDPYWKSPDGCKLRTINNFKKRSTSLIKVISFGNLVSRKKE